MHRSTTAVAVAALTLTFVVGAAAEAAAQESTELGVIGGYTRTDWDLNAAAETAVGSDLAARDNFSLGALGVLRLTPVFGIQSEATYTRRGMGFRATEVIDGQELTYDAYYEPAYVKIPLLVQLHYPSEWTVRPYLLAGPAVGFEWASRIKGTVSAGGQSAPFDVDFDDGFKGTDFGMIVGAGAATAQDGGVIYLQLRYDFGLVSILEPSDDFAGASVKNRAFGVLIGLTAPMGG